MAGISALFLASYDELFTGLSNDRANDRTALTNSFHLRSVVSVAKSVVDIGILRPSVPCIESYVWNRCPACFLIGGWCATFPDNYERCPKHGVRVVGRLGARHKVEH